MSHPRAIEKTLAVILTFAVALTGLPAVAGSSPTAGLQGKIVRAAGGGPVPGAVVKVAHRPDGKIFLSGKADERGGYALGSLPPGQYDVAVEADGGIYLVGGSVALQAGEKRTMSLSVLQEPPPPEPPAPEPPAPEPPPPAEPTPTPTTPPPTEPAKPAKQGFFHSVWGGTILVLGSAAVLGALVASSDDDEPASASPSN